MVGCPYGPGVAWTLGRISGFKRVKADPLDSRQLDSREACHIKSRIKNQFNITFDFAFMALCIPCPSASGVSASGG